MKNNNFSDIAFNRQSIKIYDEDVKINHEEMLEMINEAVKAPSAVNMQPWRFVVVDTQEGKDILRPLVRYNTRQNDTSAAMIVIFGDMKCYEKAEDIYSRTVEQGLMPEEVKQELMAVFMPEYESAPRDIMKDMVLIDSSLVAMQFMLVARAHGYDTNPMGGFEKDQIADALGMDSERYVPVMMVSIGKANYTSHGSIRLDAKEITTFK